MRTCLFIVFWMILGLNLKANSITIVNYSNCSFEISTQLPLSQILPNSTYIESNPNGIIAVKLIAEGTSEQVNFDIYSAPVIFYGQSTPTCNNSSNLMYQWIVDTDTDDMILLIFP